MNSRKQRIEAVFEAALALTSPEQRADYLNTACGNDQQLRWEIQELLEANERAGGFLAATLSESGADLTLKPFEPGMSEGPGFLIGRFKLLEKIGEGGMGVVYMAEQEEPVRRKVALKIIKLGMDTRQVVARFEAERQALAMMDHSNIAKVLDGGATETGRPYFVMELVQGVPITEFCDKNKLSVEERLKLFLPVCHAIQSAHQKGIIHRDLKPSNVLVTLHDGVPVPKVIDFGVAKAINQKLTEKTLFTNYATMLGTPAYMSPEQAEMSGLDIDTRSDIYSLGVLLYELLTGTTPFPEKRLRSVGYGEMQRIIAQEEPERPSTRLTKERLAKTAGAAKSENRAPKSEIDTDLDWIVMKCLEKDRNRRYETANGLATDISRFLSNEPVLARPPSATYRLQKLVRRNKLAFAATMAITFALLAGVAVSSWQAVRASRAEREQAGERALAEARLQTTMGYVDRVFQDVAPQLWELIGASAASETLTTNTVALLRQLGVAEETTPEFRQILGQLYLRLAFIQGWPRANSAWDPEAGLQAAREAIRLLQPAESEKPSDERIRQLARAEQVAGGAATVLRPPEEAIAHFHEMDRWAALITNSPSVGQEARNLKWMAETGPAEVLLWTGRVEEALTNYLVPWLRQLEAHGTPEQSTNVLDFGRLCEAHKFTALACRKLGRKEEALAHRREALRNGEIMTHRDPNNPEYAQDRTVLVAELGESFLSLYHPEGLERLKEALDSANSLAARDPGNSGFMLTQILVLRCFVQGLTAWAGEPAATLGERRDRLEQAQARAGEADKLIDKLRSESARKVVRFHWEPVQTELAAAKSKLTADGRTGARP